MFLARRSLLALLLIGILLTSCGGQAAGSPTPDANATINAAAETMVAALFQTQTALAPAATNTPLPTVTSLPSPTALTLPTTAAVATQPVVFFPSVTPTGTQYTATPNPSSLGVGCNNLQLRRSYTEPEGPFLPGQNFTQNWQVINNGTCDWLIRFQLVFVSGDKLGETTAVQFGKKNEPGGWTTLSVGLHAPDHNGTFKASWQMSTGSTKFGAILPVSITVSSPTKTPNAAETAAAQAATQAAAQQTAAAQQATALSAALTATSAFNTAVAGTQTAAAQTATAASATASAIADCDAKKLVDPTYKCPWESP